MARFFRRHTAARGAIALAGWLLSACSTIGAAQADEYRLQFRLELAAGDSTARGYITVNQDKALLREASFAVGDDRYSGFRGDGEIEETDGRVIWRPPATGGTIQYKVKIENRRANGAFDALVEDDWAIFRFDRVFPSARVTHTRGARSNSELSVGLPDKWSIETPFVEPPPGKPFKIVNPDRDFDRPTGWVIAGRIGIRRDIIAGIEVSVAGPVGMGIQRIAKLALMRWTLPLLAEELALPARERLSIVTADDPMWRGGLSAPNSLFIHNDRPLFSENGTSTLLHELMHVLAPIPARDDHDWIDEGIAEYISLAALRHTDTISEPRFEATVARFRERGRKIRNMKTRNSSGAITARAVAIFYDLDKELSKATGRNTAIFELVRQLMAEKQPVNLARLRELAREIAGKDTITALKTSRVPGFD